MDISAAFDAVNHLILCRRIESDFGVTGTALSWLRSFVSDRSQYVAVGSVKSETCATHSHRAVCLAVIVCNKLSLNLSKTCYMTFFANTVSGRVRVW